MAFDIVDSSYTGLDSSNLVPSFFSWLLGGALNFQNGSLWGVGLLLVVALVSFFSFKAYSVDRAMVVSSILTWIVALLSLKAGWISNGIFTVACVYVVIGIWMLYSARSQEEA